VSHIVAALVAELATRVRSALTGITSARPSRRRTGALDLARTVARNLHTARCDASGAAHLVPERLIWKTRTKKSLD
jgi:hypothetical protein